MRRLLVVLALVCTSPVLWCQTKLSVHWEELTAPDFVQALHQSNGTCLLPFGILEKHGPKKKTSMDMHAGESETSMMMITRPNLVHMDRANQQSGAEEARLHLPENLYYSGEGAAATQELGEWKMNGWIKAIVQSIRAVKGDQTSLQLQNEFFEKAKHPLDTKQ